MAALPLQHIEGKYEILEKMREGGMGAIYKVRHRLLDEIRVIKLMRQQIEEDPELKARFVREARLAIKLRHPNIAQLYDFTMDDDGTAFIVMEFIDGMTLEEILALHGPPPLGFSLELAQQSLKALGYLHLKGFIHRDISPDNLMLTADAEGQPQVKLIDLGIAKILGAGKESHLTHTGTFLGKLRYAPPEQFGSDGAMTVDARGDLYSFGIVLYELLTARFPIQGRDPSSLIAGHLFRPPLAFAEADPQGRIPEDLREVVLKALAKQPEERFASAAELSRALAAFRAPSDFAPEDLKRLLTRPFIRAGAASVADPGSTQDRLDQNFNLEPTPSPGALLTVVPPLPPGRSPSESKAVREVAGTLELRLQNGELTRAEAELGSAEEAYGEQPELRTLRDRLEEMKLREARSKARTLLQQAQGLFDSGDLEAARERLEEAQALDPGRTDAKSLLAEIEEARKKRREEAARAARVQTLLAEARELAAAERLEDALTLLDEAAELAPDHTGVRKLTQETQTALRWREEEKRRAAELAREAAALEAHLDRGELTKASELLEKTVTLYGDRGPIPELRSRLQTLQARAREKEMESAPAVEPPQAEAPRAVPPPPRVEPPPPAPPKPAPRPTARPAPAPAPNWKLWGGLAAGVLLLLAVGLFFLTHRGPAPAPTVAPSPAPVPPASLGPAVAVASGTLILDAVPWGEVSEILDADGKPQALGPQRTTPLVLPLPPGRYTVTLRNPSFPRPVSLSVTVLTGAEARSVAEFGAVSEAEFFKEMGW